MAMLLSMLAGAMMGSALFGAVFAVVVLSGRASMSQTAVIGGLLILFGAALGAYRSGRRRTTGETRRSSLLLALAGAVVGMMTFFMLGVGAFLLANGLGILTFEEHLRGFQAWIEAFGLWGGIASAAGVPTGFILGRTW